MSEFVVPTLYELLIHPDLTPGDDGGRFTGNVKIHLDVREETDQITLHAHLLNISMAKFSSSESSVQVSVESLIGVVELHVLIILSSSRTMS